MLELRGLSVVRGRRTLLRDIDATFAGGTFTAIVGANGVGKSTLLATMCGALRPGAGTIAFEGGALAALDPLERARAIALVEPTEAVLSAMSVADAVSSARFPYHRWWEWQPSPDDDTAIDDALRATELAALRTREIGTLSAGERQRVWIALALAQRARLIALDEPTSHLDLRYALETLVLLRNLADAGATVVAVLHSLEEAAGFADRIIMLGEETVIANGTPTETLTPSNLYRAYAIAVDVETRNGVPIIHRNRPR